MYFGMLLKLRADQLFQGLHFCRWWVRTITYNRPERPLSCLKFGGRILHNSVVTFKLDI